MGMVNIWKKAFFCTTTVPAKKYVAWVYNLYGNKWRNAVLFLLLKLSDYNGDMMGVYTYM